MVARIPPPPTPLRPRGALVHPGLSAGPSRTGNFVIHADNEEALSALSAEFQGAVRCIYIDPPYNNQELYAHYNDRQSHEAWLRGIVRRLNLLAPLLTEDGSIWISIDDREMHYLKVAADGVFGRANFITTIVWQHRTTRENRKAFSNNHEYILVYARDARRFRRACGKLAPSESVLARYKNPDGDPRGAWQSVSANVQAGHATASQFYTLVAPNGRRHRPPNGRCWVYTREKMMMEIKRGNVWFGRSGDGVPRLKRFLKSAPGLTPETLWMASDVGTTDTAKKHLLSLFPTGVVFDTPKPERLIARVLSIATGPGDLVLDAFLGSGTTAAVAHMMGRRYIGIERDRGAAELAAARLRAVVDGVSRGVSAGVEWAGGGGFDFLTLADAGRQAASAGNGSTEVSRFDRRRAAAVRRKR